MVNCFHVKSNLFRNSLIIALYATIQIVLILYIGISAFVFSIIYLKYVLSLFRHTVDIRFDKDSVVIGSMDVSRAVEVKSFYADSLAIYMDLYSYKYEIIGCGYVYKRSGRLVIERYMTHDITNIEIYLDSINIPRRNVRLSESLRQMRFW